MRQSRTLSNVQSAGNVVPERSRMSALYAARTSDHLLVFREVIPPRTMRVSRPPIIPHLLDSPQRSSRSARRKHLPRILPARRPGDIANEAESHFPKAEGEGEKNDTGGIAPDGSPTETNKSRMLQQFRPSANIVNNIGKVLSGTSSRDRNKPPLPAAALNALAVNVLLAMLLLLHSTTAFHAWRRM